jgi:hypothetical protein
LWNESGKGLLWRADSSHLRAGPVAAIAQQPFHERNVELHAEVIEDALQQ